MYLSCLAVSEFVLRKSIPMLGSFKHFTENGIRFTENQFLMFGSFKHFTENEIRFTENQFPCLVCGSFYGKYEMPYKFSTCIA